MLDNNILLPQIEVLVIARGKNVVLTISLADLNTILQEKTPHNEIDLNNYGSALKTINTVLWKVVEEGLTTLGMNYTSEAIEVRYRYKNCVTYFLSELLIMLRKEGRQNQ